MHRPMMSCQSCLSLSAFSSRVYAPRNSSSSYVSAVVVREGKREEEEKEEVGSLLPQPCPVRVYRADIVAGCVPHVSY